MADGKWLMTINKKGMKKKEKERKEKKSTVTNLLLNKKRHLSKATAVFIISHRVVGCCLPLVSGLLRSLPGISTWAASPSKEDRPGRHCNLSSVVEMTIKRQITCSQPAYSLTTKGRMSGPSRRTSKPSSGGPQTTSVWQPDSWHLSGWYRSDYVH